MWAMVWSHFEDVRTEIFNLMMQGDDAPDKTYTQPEAKRIMQEAYVTFARPLEEGVANPWAEKVADVAKNHATVMENMRASEFTEQNDADPRLTGTSRNIAGFQHSKTIHGGVKVDKVEEVKKDNELGEAKYDEKTGTTTYTTP